MASSSSNNPYIALKIPEFRLFIAGRFCFTLAMQIQAVIVGWQVYDLTKDPFSLGLIGLAEAIPSIVVALYAGHLADIKSRKKIIIFGNLVLIFCLITLFAYSLNLKNLIGRFGVLPIYSVIFLTGIARGFISPVVFSFMSQILPSKSLYPNAVSWNITVWQAASVGGPAVGGLIYGFFGLSVAYAAGLCLIFSAFILFSQIVAKPLPETPQEFQKRESLLTGIRFVFNNRLILNAMSLDLFAVLFGGAIALLPIFASDILQAGPQGLGFLRSPPAIGSILIGLYLTHHPIGKNAGKKMLMAVTGFGICMILFGISTNYYLSLILLLLSGVFDSISVIVRHTLMQTLIPEHLKGRVSSVNSIFVGSSNEIGAFESGLTASMMGAATSVIFGGAMTLLVVIFTAFKAKKLRELNL